MHGSREHNPDCIWKALEIQQHYVAFPCTVFMLCHHFRGPLNAQDSSVTSRTPGYFSMCYPTWSLQSLNVRLSQFLTPLAHVAGLCPSLDFPAAPLLLQIQCSSYKEAGGQPQRRRPQPGSFTEALSPLFCCSPPSSPLRATLPAPSQ